jgi:PAS domain-containing protein
VSRFGETLAELPFTGNQVVCLGRDQAASSGPGGSIRLFGRKKDGSEFPVEIGLNPIETDEGLMVLAAVVDITERKAEERALRESEHRARSLVDRL